MEPNVSAPVQEAIQHITSSETPLNTQLTELNGLSAAELSAFNKAWGAISAERRQQIMRRLSELAEDNLELNFDSIFKSGLKDTDAEVRSAAIEGLWENEETSLITPLIELLKNDTSEQVQTAAAIALAKFALLAENNKLRPEYKDRIGQALLAAAGDKNRPTEVRRRALEAAAPLSLPQVKQAIKQAYRSPDARLKVSSLYAMGKSFDPDWLPELLDELASPDAEMRYEACNACGELEAASAVPDIIELVDDSDSDVRLAAILALGKIGTPQARNCIKECLESSNDNIRETAEQAMSEMEAREDPLSFRRDSNN